jgi:apolipoprotein N-acyltransferase
MLRSSARPRAARAPRAPLAPNAPPAPRSPFARPVRGGRARFAPALAVAFAASSGVAQALAAPGRDVPVLPFVYLVPLLLAQSGRTPAASAALGFVQALAFGAVAQGWLVASAADFTHLPRALAAAFALAAWAHQAGRGALAGWLQARLEARTGSLLAAAAVATVASEFAYPLLFPWYAGVVAHRALPLVQLAELAGPTLVSAALAVVGAAVATALRAAARRDAAALREPLAGAALVALAAAWGRARLDEVAARVAAAPKLRVGVVQANAAPGQAYDDPETIVFRHARLTREAAARGADFAVWSEAAVGFTVVEAEAGAFFRDYVARRLAVPALFGTVFTSSNAAGPRAAKRNAAVVLAPDGALTGRYDKRELMPFGETIPFERWWPGLRDLFPRAGHYEPGDGRAPVVVYAGGRAVRAATVICYEALNAPLVNELVRDRGADLLVTLANDVWFGRSAEPWQHLALAAFRAVEHRRYLVRGANSGVSAVVDPAGRVVARTDVFREDVLAADVALLDAPTVYERLGDAPAAALTALAFGAALTGRRRPAPRGAGARSRAGGGAAA